jgi:type I restriction enzyme S subunit
MIADLKPYPEYKESGTPWLGQVPGHWDVSPLAGLARLKSVVNQSERQLLSVYLQRGVVRFADVDEKRTNATSEDLSNYQAVDPGDFVLNNQQAWRGSVGVSDYSGIVSPAYLVLALSKRYSPRYANLLFRDQSMVSQYLVCSKGVGTIQRNLYWPHLKRVGVVVPPPDEQAVIVRFLDWANGRLERAIRAKRKVIALLNEQKQAIIHRAVTRGLDPSVPLKPSGIPWLGDIPKHWELWRISRFARVGNGSTPSRANAAYWHGGTYPWLNSSQVNRGHIDGANQFVTQLALHECHLPKVPAGSVLVAITGQGRTRGMSAVLSIEATINQHIAFITPRMPVASPEFIHLALTAAYLQLRAASDDSGSTKGAITCEELKRFKVPIPPRAEQDGLLRRIQAETRELDTAAFRLEREIELLREYRTRLVADVVTGKLDVREAVVRLPDEVPLDSVEHEADVGDEAETADEEATV